MDSMPSSMKDSFTAKIKFAAEKEVSIRKILLKDIDSDRTMVTIEK